MPINKRNKFLWFAFISVLITFFFSCAVMFFFWHNLKPNQQDFLFYIAKENAAYFFISFLLFFAALAFAIDALLNNFFIPMTKLTDEVVSIYTSNPSHRIKMEGSKEILNLAAVINDFADSYENLNLSVSEKINITKYEVEKEKNMLAALLDELPQGIITCNAEGIITLFNKKAKTIETKNRFIGIGRSIFGIIDKDTITNALYEINVKKNEKDEAASSSFITLGGNNNLIKTDISPITDSEDNFTGFILVFYDITKDFELYSKIDAIFKYTSENIIAILDKINSACHGDSNFQSEINYIKNSLEKTEKDYMNRIKKRLPFLVVSDRDIMVMIAKRAKEKLGISFKPEFPPYINWIKIETYSFIYAFMSILIFLKSKTMNDSFLCDISKDKNFLIFFFYIHNSGEKESVFKKWTESINISLNQNNALTLKNFLSYHEANFSFVSSKESEKAGFKLVMPIAEMKEPDEKVKNITIISKETAYLDMPSFFDFSLFSKQSDNSKALDSYLKDISYTVFDTETTGLDTKNDEIISIGAVRIVNSKIRNNERFYELIDPKIDIPLESQKIHGINKEMLKGKPYIERILPLFYKFAQDTVLVAHNAAFDMKMFEMKQKKTGIKFDNPLLDTMLLANVIYATHEKHNMRTIAEFVGIEIAGRHTAIGDAVTTAQIFLKLIPLLEKKGIYTLKDAVEASKKSLYAKLKY